MSDKAAQYSKSSKAQRFWNRALLDSIPWPKTGCRVVDIGCGTGETTRALVAERDGVESVVAFDKAPDRISFAERHCSHEKIVYGVADIAVASTLEVEWMAGAFTRALALHVFHWVQDQEAALANVSSMLAPGGDMLLCMGVRIPRAFEYVKEEIVRDARWTAFVSESDAQWRHNKTWDRKNETWRYPDPASGYRKLCENAGFDVAKCDVGAYEYEYESKAECRGMLEYLLPYTAKIPKELAEEYGEEVYRLYESKARKSESGRIMWDAQFLVVHGKKKT